MVSTSQSKASTDSGAAADASAKALGSEMRPDRRIQIKAISGEVVLDTSEGPHLCTVQQLKSLVRRRATPEGTSIWCGVQLLSDGKVLENSQLLADLEGGQDTEVQDALPLTLVRLAEPEPVTEDEVNSELKRAAGQFNYKFRPSEEGYDESAWQEHLATRITKEERQKMRRQLEEEREVKWRVRKVYGTIDGKTTYDADLNFQEFVYGDGCIGYDPKDQSTLGHYAHMTRAYRVFDLSASADTSARKVDFAAEKERVRQAGLLREGPIEGFQHQLLPAVATGRAAKSHHLQRAGSY
eukprot:TRINITY_DN79231_c0_g1_i1.p1 TRINITY_DN79231_c0_g1~~TRINITY_DN79231_c0_g1_i1.p1  ORF type:complete len:297 (-),score=57.93 TRINITY_DN79231_c0_g1_i1:78-968(-)